VRPVACRSLWLPRYRRHASIDDERLADGTAGIDAGRMGGGMFSLAAGSGFGNTQANRDRLKRKTPLGGGVRVAQGTR